MSEEKPSSGTNWGCLLVILFVLFIGGCFKGCGY